MAKYRIDIFDRDQPQVCITAFTNSHRHRIPHRRRLIEQGDTRFSALAQIPKHRIQFRVMLNTFIIHRGTL